MTPTSAIDRNFPTFRRLAAMSGRLAAPFRWFFRSRRRVSAVAAVLLAMLIAPPLWWSIQLLGLPDIGEPFDEAAFHALHIPDDRNAMVLYDQAAERLKVLANPPHPGGERVDPRVRWSKADPLVRGWVEKNREAMELFRRGADRPDAMPLAGPRDAGSDDLQLLALLEASRLEDAGDMAGAWTWYRAALRATYHRRLRASMLDRRIALHYRGEIAKRIATWAADPRTTPTMIRRAIDDALACASLMPSESYGIRADYLLLKGYVDGSKNRSPGRNGLIFRLKSLTFGATQLQLDTDLIPTIADAWVFWRREPERSRRVLRLAVANWLAYYDLPPDRRPPPAPDLTGTFDFYAFGPEAPAAARALSPKALDRWLATTMDAQALLQAWDSRSVRFGEQAGYRALVVQLASQLYRRDHGRGPDSEQDLVGPYLKALPDDGFGDPGDTRGGKP